MASPFFSIIIPTLNEEAYLPKLLSALNQQTFTDFEVIVVDGHSDDKTQELIKNFRASYPLTIYATNYRNVSLQRNYGAKKARGKYLFFVDADMYFPRIYLEKLYTNLIDTLPDFASTSLKFDQRKFIHKIWFMVANSWKKIFAQFGSPVMSAQNLIFLKEKFHILNGFNSDVVNAEDIELVLRANKFGLKGIFFNDLVATTSSRRLVREGGLTVSLKQTYSQFYTLLIGPIKKPLFPYQMGGAYHQARDVSKIQY